MGKPGEDALKAALSTQNTQAREQFLQIAARIPEEPTSLIWRRLPFVGKD